ncbi:META domain-containing protein [Aurantiacibacter odishensis]|uniref:META domain-containing protein n=1 Tax=Aurantiacibacter odishensis TaxID=1155476 RepID=UPI0013C4AA6A|nr:META domain-containing protein [Aurantiacibacter odishensis]
MQLRKLFCLTIGAGSLAACATTPDLSPDEGALVSSEWALVSIMDDNEDVRLRPQFSERHTLNFEADGSLYIQLDCNRGTADWRAYPGSAGSGDLNIGPVASTRALCPEPSYGERLASALPGATGYRVTPGVGTLTIITQDAVFGFEARP